MTPHESLDPRAILASLGLSGASEITPISGGADTAIWRVVHGRQSYALRVFRPEQAAVSEREVIVMRAAQAGGLPVPAVHAAGSWRDRPALLLGWCAGEPLLHALARRPWRIWRLGAAFGRMQAAIHAIAPEAHPQLEPAAWIGWAGAGETALQERLRAMTPAAARLLHLDYHPLNVMTDGRQITAVLDWANARIGDPRADLARTHTILTLDPAWPRQPHITVFRRLLARAWRRGYEQAHGPTGDLALFYAWAGAAMLRDLGLRAARGTGPRPEELEPVRAWIAAWKRRAGLPV
jgi:aminoglycoside phosphotransferase (APT) family kinase protein